jgi:hypothetical protein
MPQPWAGQGQRRVEDDGPVAKRGLRRSGVVGLGRGKRGGLSWGPDSRGMPAEGGSADRQAPRRRSGEHRLVHRRPQANVSAEHSGRGRPASPEHRGTLGRRDPLGNRGPRESRSAGTQNAATAGSRVPGEHNGHRCDDPSGSESRPARPWLAAGIAETAAPPCSPVSGEQERAVPVRVQPRRLVHGAGARSGQMPANASACEWRAVVQAESVLCKQG